MKRIMLALVVTVSLFAFWPKALELIAATPSSGTISRTSPTVRWTGGPFAVSNPVSCRTVPEPCDFFTLRVSDPPRQQFAVVIQITGSAPNDLDLFVRQGDRDGPTIASSGTSGNHEGVTLFNPPAGTYTIVVQPFLVVPGATYDGVASIDTVHTEFSNCYRGVPYPATFVGVPDTSPAECSTLTPELKVSFNYVGRQAAEPTLGVNAKNTAFYAAATFDFPTAGSPRRLARTVVLRSRDKGVTWEPKAGFALSAESVDEPPFTLDPMLHVDALANPLTRNGRVFSVDLNLACGANAVFSDDEGETWQSRPGFACSTPVNDHHTIVTARPPAGFVTVGYPNMLYFCFNRVSDSSCARSRDGGNAVPFEPAGTAFVASDPNAGSFCGGLTGHLAADSTGRIFLPKGHCGTPWVAISKDGGNNWGRVQIARHAVMEDHEVSLAVDTADNIYAVWADTKFRLPMLSISRDHGRTWSTPLAIGPPGVHEVNFPTIVAGDPGRIALLFPGSESTDFDDPQRPWNIYIVVSTNALDSNPLFTWTTANNPKDPVHRGNCGPGRCDAQDGGSMFDFLDIQVSPADGLFWGTASDTCVGACVKDPTAQ